MFGEKPIVGQTIIRIQNNRIVLPEFTYSEPGETISAMLDPYQRKLILMKEQELIRRLMEYDQKIELARREKRINYQRYHDLKRYFFGILPLHERELNKKKQYLLFSSKPEDACEQRIIRRLNLRDQVFAIGLDTSLEIFSSSEAYQDYLKFKEDHTKKLEKK